MKRFLLTGGLVLGMMTAGWAQQRPQYTQYMVNSYLFNPAITGIEDYTDIKFGSRQQWIGLEGAPKTYFLTAHSPLNKALGSVRSSSSPGGVRTVNRNKFVPAYPHHGAGIIAVVDKAGPLRRTNVNLSYAYHLPVTRSITISLGAYGGILRNSFNASEATFSNPAEPALNSDFLNRNFIDVGLGTWIYAPNFYLGFSGAQLLHTELKASEGSVTEGIIQRHFFGMAGYKFRVTPAVTLIPSVLVKIASPSPTTVDANLRAVYADRFWVGATYRTKDAYAAMLGLNVTHFLEMSYAYDYNTSNLNIANSGSHEVTVGVRLFNKGKVLCPRWMN
ncbi:type IX secretion system membrane protein PorP/SprF [Nibribacter ruber]|uniref:Type IX secretion system membrane protein PorP/SprF n=1 Tax=Nibribacter ruber TaxID=2698458 RepID=A0A6P1NWQ8_9BACT|nr:type IX secretion system membrane protein PorP/SprF [Nibribacter ruber]QHL86659.1 type IX secretion system membrane protein PorP/SprF [Nibribacter ruber]